MPHEHEKQMLDKEIKKMNEEIRELGYRLSELLNVDCNFGVCSFDPEVDDAQEKMKEVEEQKKLLEYLKKNISGYKSG